MPEVRALTARLQVSCDRCRARKRKCDGLEPCRSCIAAASECTFLGLFKRPSRSKKLLQLQSGLLGISHTAGEQRNMQGATGPASRGAQAGTVGLAGTLGTDFLAAFNPPVPPPEMPLMPLSQHDFDFQSWTGPVSPQSTAFGLPGGSASPSPTSHFGVPPDMMIVGRNPAAFPTLPSMPIIMACLERFFLSSDMNLPTLHRGRFYERWPPSGLLLSAVLLYAPVFDPSVSNLIAGYSPKKEWDRDLFSLAKMELSALFDWRPDSVPDVTDNIVATFLLGIWAAFSGLTKMSKGLYDVTQNLARAAGWYTSRERPAKRFRDLLVERFGPAILSANLTPQQISALRDLWIDEGVQHRTMSVFAIAEQTRKDWMRAIDQDPDPGEFDGCYRPAPPSYATWEQSFDPAFDPRMVPDTPLIIDVIGWVDLDRTDYRRELGLKSLGDNILYVRGTLPHLHAKLRATVDGFLRACRVAGLSSPAELPPVSKSLPPNVPLETLNELMARRDAIDACLTDLRANLPPTVLEAWHRGSASRMIAALLPTWGQFYNVYNLCSHIPSMLLMRSELYTSIGVCFTRGFDAELMGDNLALLADEFGCTKEPFAQFLEDAMLFSRFNRELLSLNPSLQHHTASDMAVILRTTILHMSFLKRFLNAISHGQGGLEATISNSVLQQVSWDVNVLLEVLEAFAVRHKGFFASAYNFIRKLNDNQHLSPFEIEAARLRVDLEPELSDGEEAEGPLPAKSSPVDRSLANLLAAYQSRIT